MTAMLFLTFHKFVVPTRGRCSGFQIDTLTWVHNNIDDPAVREHVSCTFASYSARIIHLQAPHVGTNRIIGSSLTIKNICNLFQRYRP